MQLLCVIAKSERSRSREAQLNKATEHIKTENQTISPRVCVSEEANEGVGQVG